MFSLTYGLNWGTSTYVFPVCSRIFQKVARMFKLKFKLKISDRHYTFSHKSFQNVPEGPRRFQNSPEGFSSVTETSLPCMMSAIYIMHGQYLALIHFHLKLQFFD